MTIDQLSDLVVSGASLITFGAIVWAVRGHFSSSAIPAAMSAVSVLSAAAFLAFLYELWARPQPAWATFLGLALQGAGLALFVGAVRASRAQRLTLAFDTDAPCFCFERDPIDTSATLSIHPMFSSGWDAR